MKSKRVVSVSSTPTELKSEGNPRDYFRGRPGEGAIMVRVFSILEVEAIRSQSSAILKDG